MPNTLQNELLKHVPDFTSWEDARLWIARGQQAVQQINLESVAETDMLSLAWDEIKDQSELPFGLYTSIQWRKFVLATFLADLVCYSNPVDQVNFDRLLFVMQAFPQGFRTWWIKREEDWWPIGYSGWYPMLETQFELFQKHPEKIKDRMVVPNVSSTSQKKLLYLFNCSVIPSLKKSSLSKTLMKEVTQDMGQQNAQGLAAIVVSDDGVRVAKRLGMTCSGYFEIDGSREAVYTGIKKTTETVRSLRKDEKIENDFFARDTEKNPRQGIEKVAHRFNGGYIKKQYCAPVGSHEKPIN